ncbi:MAG: riboflavin synthase [Ruminococcus sp.]|nr:riboflavin synthase [Ruminococcus sp.]
MFTGIIEEVGTVKAVQRSGNNSFIRIQADKILSDVHLGDSIAVNGVCLTVTKFDGSIFQADVMNETLSRSSLGSLKTGSIVNLERAMSANGRFGGHIVSGHIDGTGNIINIKNDGIAIWYTIKANNNIMRYIVEKGSVAIDGISLTVAEVGKNNFSVSIIPHTSGQTILSSKKVGDIVNLENDIIGKYIEKLMNTAKSESVIDMNFLAERGFL